MDQTDTSALIAYNFWANDRILSACELVYVRPRVLGQLGHTPSRILQKTSMMV